MSVSSENTSNIIGLIGKRHISYEAVQLDYGVRVLSATVASRLELMASLHVRFNKYCSEEFMVFRIMQRLNLAYNGSISPKLYVADEEASNALVNGIALDHINRRQLGRLALGSCRFEPVVIGNVGPFGHKPNRYGTIPSKCVSVQIHEAGTVEIQDISPLGTDIYADFAGAFGNVCLSLLSDNKDADILEFPLKSMS